MDQRRPDDVVRALGRFGELVSDSSSTLDQLTLALSAVLQPDLDTQRWLDALEALAASCVDSSREGVMRHLFASGRLMGDTSTYASWRNSCIDQVLARGRGLPITLAVIGIEIGRRLGTPFVGVGMPAHFLLGDPHDRRWFADPFHSGRALDAAGCRELYEQVTGDPTGWSRAFLRPTPSPAIIARMLNNLTSAVADDPVRLALVTRMRLALPDSARGRTNAPRDLAALN